MVLQKGGSTGGPPAHEPRRLPLSVLQPPVLLLLHSNHAPGCKPSTGRALRCKLYVCTLQPPASGLLQSTAGYSESLQRHVESQSIHALPRILLHPLPTLLCFLTFKSAHVIRKGVALQESTLLSSLKRMHALCFRAYTSVQKCAAGPDIPYVSSGPLILVPKNSTIVPNLM